MNQEVFVSKDWLDILDILKEDKGIAIILGAPDTGKSTLSRFLISNLCQKGISVSLIDSDIGQSFLGPPTTIGFLLFDSPPDWNLLPEPEIFFVGSNYPENSFDKHLRGVKLMLDKALHYSSEVILIDTTGYVFGEGGKELKRRKIDLVSPKFIISLQREKEIENILSIYENSNQYRIIRLKTPESVRTKSMEERKRYRQRKFQEFFKGSIIYELEINKIHLKGEMLDSIGFPVPINWALQTEGLLMGLKENEEKTLSLGLIKDYNQKGKILKILTPLKDIKMVRVIELGSIILSDSFEDKRL